MVTLSILSTVCQSPYPIVVLYELCPEKYAICGLTEQSGRKKTKTFYSVLFLFSYVQVRSKYVTINNLKHAVISAHFK